MYAMVNSAINKISTFVPASILVVGLVIGLALPAKAGKELINLDAMAGEGVLVPVAARRLIPGQDAPTPYMPPSAIDPTAVPPPSPSLPREFIPIPDRWGLIEAVGVHDNWLDPYNQNTLKGDRPLFGDDWFLNLSVISDTVFEARRLPTGISPQASRRAGSNDLFGKGEQYFIVENLIINAALIKGDTTYKPPDWEIRFTPVISINYADVEEVRVLKADPREGTTRSGFHVGLQDAFVDKHLRNVSSRYDFESIRIGIQPFSTDFRGFLFQDNQLGVRLFGNRFNNIFQYNVAWFRRLEKDTNSGLNDVTEDLRDDDIFLGNLYVQDFPVRGFVSQVTVVHNRNREDDEFFFNDNEFLERPASFGDERGHDYDVTYLGFNGDGHFGRINLTVSTYYAIGNDTHNQVNGSFEGEESDIRAYFAAVEPSVDFDWIRLRGSFLYASGDSDPFDNNEEGFDAIFENPQFAGGDTSYWIRQGIPFVGGGGVNLTQRNGVLPSLRTSKEHGQSNFNNPGLVLFGGGADFDILPELRFSMNVNKLYFEDTSVLEALRNQGDIDTDIGWDLSGAFIYRPFQSQNVIFRLSGAVLVAGDGFKELYTTAGDDGSTKDLYYSVLANLILAY